MTCPLHALRQHIWGVLLGAWLWPLVTVGLSAVVMQAAFLMVPLGLQCPAGGTDTSIVYSPSTVSGCSRVVLCLISRRFGSMALDRLLLAGCGLLLDPCSTFGFSAVYSILLGASIRCHVTPGGTPFHAAPRCPLRHVWGEAWPPTHWLFGAPVARFCEVLGRHAPVTSVSACPHRHGSATSQQGTLRKPHPAFPTEGFVLSLAFLAADSQRTTGPQAQCPCSGLQREAA